MPRALSPSPPRGAAGAAPGSSSRLPATPPSRAAAPPAQAQARRPARPPPSARSTARRPAALPPAVRATAPTAPASGSTAPGRCAGAGRPALPVHRRCNAPAVAPANACRSSSAPKPRGSCAPSPAARSPGNAAPPSLPWRRDSSPPTPKRSDVPRPVPCLAPPRIMTQQPNPFRFPGESLSTESNSRIRYHTPFSGRARCAPVANGRDIYSRAHTVSSKTMRRLVAIPPTTVTRRSLRQLRSVR